MTSDLPDASPPRQPGARQDALADSIAARGLPGGDDAVLYQRSILSLDALDAVYDDGAPPQLLMTTYDYLGLLGHPVINDRAKQAIDDFGTGGHGTCAAAGSLRLQRTLEEALAAYTGKQSALLFPSGYQANQSAISAIAGPGDHVFSDGLNHASIVEGCHAARARGARVHVFRHNDAAHLAELLAQADGAGTRLVVCDAVFSADGDLLDLPAIGRACRRYRAHLYLDEAHSLGVLGPEGRGLHDHFGVPVDGTTFVMATLSKTLASTGGFVAASRPLVDALRQAGRGHVFSGAPSAPAVAAALAALEVMDAEGGRRRALLRRNIAHLARRFRAARLPCPAECQSGIVPVLVGAERRTLDIADRCRRQGVMVVPFTWPACARGRARLRVNVTARHTARQIDIAADRIVAAFHATGPAGL